MSQSTTKFNRKPVAVAREVEDVSAGGALHA